MKQPFTLISRLAILALAGGLSISAANAQDMEQSGSGDATGHPTADSPFLRNKPKSTASAQPQATKLSQKDQKFLSQIAAGGVQEVQDAQVAMKEGNATTKNIASRISSERGAANRDLMALAKKKGLGLGTDKIKARNMGKSNYDAQYVHTTTADVQEDLNLLNKAAAGSDDKDIKAWAAKTAPMVRGHLAMLKSAKGSGVAKAKE
jgi:putative membrane protein